MAGRDHPCREEGPARNAGHVALAVENGSGQRRTARLDGHQWPEPVLFERLPGNGHSGARRRLPGGVESRSRSGHGCLARRRLEIVRRKYASVCGFSTVPRRDASRLSLMFALGLSLPKLDVRATSTFPLLATEERKSWKVQTRQCTKPEVASLIRSPRPRGREGRRDLDTERFRRLEINEKQEFDGLLN